MPERPGGQINKRPLHFIWICDCSGSMTGKKINELNRAIPDGLDAMRDEAKGQPHAEVKVRVLKFDTNVEWEIETATPIDQVQWRDLSASGLTNMGEALSTIAEQMKMPPMEKRALPPVLGLVSDGAPTDNFDAGLQDLLSKPWGQKAFRFAIFLGSGGKDEREVLERFIDNPEVPPLFADNPEKLTQYVRWASTEVIRSASSPPSVSSNDENVSSGNVRVTVPDDSDSGNSSKSVW